MKHYIFCLILAAGWFLAGCTFDESLTSQKRIKEGIPTAVNLKFGMDGGQVYTRAETEEPSANEARVANLYVLVFDSNGNRVPTTDDSGNDKAFFSEGSGLTVNPGTPVSGSVSFNVASMSGATVASVANISEDGVTTVYTLKKATLDNISTIDDFKQLVVPMMKSIIRGNYMLMSAMEENVTISGTESDASTDCTLTLRRVGAKINVIMTSAPSNASWTDFSFQPKTWRVMRVPLQTRLVPFEHETYSGPWEEIDSGTPSEWDAPATGDGYFDTQAEEFDDVTYEDKDNTLYYKGGSFSFYMPENREVAKKNVTDYALREKRAADGSFEYANDNSTYLEITGYISYTDTDKKVVNAEVTFYVHLGYAKSDGSPTPNVNDYDTRQNGSYTYNITVTGVESIKVEVNNDNEQRPGYEGNVVISSNVINVDAHYETCTLDISIYSPFEDMTWGVRTRFSSGIYSGSGEPGAGLKDYQWIKFAINKHFDVDYGYYVSFPGLGPFPYVPYKPGERTKEEIDKLVEDDTPPLLDIDQLIKYLKAKYAAKEISSLVADGTSDHICITAFVDEYLYTEDPEGKVKSSTPELFWKKCVDTDDRQMHILTPDGDIYSNDLNSSVVTSRHTITQKSIRTIYNKEADDNVLSTAWGLESNSSWGTSSAERLNPGDVQKGSSLRDGRANSLQWMEGSWNTYVDFSTNTLKSDYNNAAYACLMRNRDEDGDGEIDKNEIKWYLAAIDQLTDIYIGEWALNEASRLYPRDEANRPGGKPPYWHYTSSSADGSYPWVLWAEEGASRGTYFTNNGKPDDSKSLNGEMYSYRCLRNLGVNDNSNYTIDDIQDIIFIDQGSPDASGNYTFNLSRMNPKSLRTRTDAPLQAHDETSVWNLPYEKFEMNAATLNANKEEPDYYRDRYYEFPSYKYRLIFSNSYNWQTYNNTAGNPCPDGYRMPNLRELLIMSTRLPKNEWPEYVIEAEGLGYARPEVRSKAMYISKTGFSMCGIDPYTDERRGFIYDAQSDKIFLQNNDGERGYVRCIKDIDPQQ